MKSSTHTYTTCHSKGHCNLLFFKVDALFYFYKAAAWHLLWKPLFHWADNLATTRRIHSMDETQSWVRTLEAPTFFWRKQNNSNRFGIFKLLWRHYSQFPSKRVPFILHFFHHVNRSLNHFCNKLLGQKPIFPREKAKMLYAKDRITPSCESRFHLCWERWEKPISVTCVTLRKDTGWLAIQVR